LAALLLEHGGNLHRSGFGLELVCGGKTIEKLHQPGKDWLY